MSLLDKFDQNRRAFEAENRRRIAEASLIYQQQLAAVLGDQGTKDHPSYPGEAPHKVTGRLQSSITANVDETNLEAEVGTSAPYGKYLLQSRPYLRIAFDKVAARLRQVLLDR